MDPIIKRLRENSLREHVNDYCNNYEKLNEMELPDDDKHTIIRAEHHPINTADRPNIPMSEDINIAEEGDFEEYINNSPDILEGAIIQVMTSYQNANRWLDSIKECLLIDFDLPYFSNIVHQLAHSMPVRFDSFGDILHTVNRKIPYPSTEEYIEPEDLTIENLFGSIFSILNSIRDSLYIFKEFSEKDNSTAPLSLQCDALVIDIQNEYDFYTRALKQLAYYHGNYAQWDKKMASFYEDKDKIK